MDHKRISDSPQPVTRGGRALSRALTAALCDVYAHRYDYHVTDYFEAGFMVVVAEDTYLSIVYFQQTDPLGWDDIEMLRGPDHWRFIPDKVIVHLDFKGLGGGCISERLCEGFGESTLKLEDLFAHIKGICAWQSGLPHDEGLMTSGYVVDYSGGYVADYPDYLPSDVLICGKLRHLTCVRSFIEELYKYAEVHIASDDDPAAAVEPHVRAWFERAIDDWLEGLADDGPTNVLPGAKPRP